MALGIAVFSSLFPSRAQPSAGLFIRERMFRVAPPERLLVVSPQPWFPLQSLIRRIAPGYRAGATGSEIQSGVQVLFPRFLSIPGVLRRFDGLSMAVCTWLLMRRLRNEGRIGLIDAHFAYPCGYAATWLGRWLDLPVAVTLRGTEVRQLADRSLRPRVVAAVMRATRVFSVSDSLRKLLAACGVDPKRIHVIGNGVDLTRFRALPRAEARAKMALPPDVPILVSVGGLVPRKGFHRVIELLPALIHRFPDLRYLVVGGPSPEGDMTDALRAQVRTLGLERHVVFTGPLPPDELHLPLSAADVFVLSTANEGWANVFLEAMACGLPVVTTDVGGNAEVVNSPRLGRVVPFDEPQALQQAIDEALTADWDREQIIAYARSNDWDQRIKTLRAHFSEMAMLRTREATHS
ncbi:MAG: glycosyl transferase family 1 [Rubrivivax sp. SCN 70-15]|nr:MAG: glycosyl transferase family 1 [Rubrivivax sp. SCN 70-15]